MEINSNLFSRLLCFYALPKKSGGKRYANEIVGIDLEHLYFSRFSVYFLNTKMEATTGTD